MDDWEKAVKNYQKASKKRRTQGTSTMTKMLWALFLISFFTLYIYNY